MAGSVRERKLAFPAIVSTDKPLGWIVESATWSRRVVSVSCSFLGHVGILAWLGYSSGTMLHRTVPVQQGHASIQLSASIAADAQQATEEETEPIRFDLSEPHETESNEQTETVSPTEWEPADHGQCKVPDRALLAQVDAPETKMPSKSDLVIFHEQLVRKDIPSSDDSPSLDEFATMMRRSSDRSPTLRLKADVTSRQASKASLPSPATQASDGADSLPSVVHNPAPAYPRDALLARKTGRVLLSVELAADGSVAAAAIYRSCGIPSLDRAALKAVWRWRFTPAGSDVFHHRRIGVPINFEIVEPVQN